MIEIRILLLWNLHTIMQCKCWFPPKSMDYGRWRIQYNNSKRGFLYKNSHGTGPWIFHEEILYHPSRAVSAASDIPGWLRGYAAEQTEHWTERRFETSRWHCGPCPAGHAGVRWYEFPHDQCALHTYTQNMHLLKPSNWQMAINSPLYNLKSPMLRQSLVRYVVSFTYPHT